MRPPSTLSTVPTCTPSAPMTSMFSLISIFCSFRQQSRLHWFLDTEFFANRGGGFADFIDRPLKLLARYTKGVGPVFDLVVLVHVDFRTIGLMALREIIGHGVLPSRENACA